MDGSKVIRQLMIERNLNIVQLAELLDIKPQSARNKLSRNSFSLSEFEKVLSVLGAELQAVTTDTNKVYR